MSRTIEFYTISEAAKLLGCAAKRAIMMAAKKQFPGAIWYDAEWLIPMRDLQAVTRLDTNPEFVGLTWGKRRGAMGRWSKLRQYNHLLQTAEYVRSRWGGKELRKEAAGKVGVPLSTLQRWQHRVRLTGLRGLVDSRGGDHRHKERVAINTVL